MLVCFTSMGCEKMFFCPICVIMRFEYEDPLFNLWYNSLLQVISRTGKAEVLTSPHRPYGNNKASLEEVKRIRAAGGWVSFLHFPSALMFWGLPLLHEFQFACLSKLLVCFWSILCENSRALKLDNIEHVLKKSKWCSFSRDIFDT